MIQSLTQKDIGYVIVAGAITIPLVILVALHIDLPKEGIVSFLLKHNTSMIKED